MIFPFPDVRSTFDGFASLAELSNATKACSMEVIEIDMSATTWFDANMSAALGVVFTQLADRLNTVQPVKIRNKVETILSKNLFLEGFGYPNTLDSNGTVIPYRRFKPEDDRYFASYLNKHLTGKGIPRMSDGLGRCFKDSILEIFANSAGHSETKLGIFACGQFFPMQGRLDFCVADAGIGFRRKIRKELGLAMNSDKAILWALEEGNTTRKGAVPGGLGLKLLREFISLNGGRIQIVSDRGFWELDARGETVKRMDLTFPGTVVNLEINTADQRSYCLKSETFNQKEL